MSKVTGKTVYILGAGASVHTGAPLLRDFLVAARLLLNRKEKLEHRDKFESVFKFIDSLRGASYYIDFDLDNIEHIFSLAEMKRQLGNAEGKDIYTKLRYLIMETLSNTCLIRKGSLNREDAYMPDDTYLKFADFLKRLNDDRHESIDKSIFEQDVIITFNYDVMLDYAMYAKKLGIDYCLETYKEASQNGYKVLKLHGSSNWGECTQCKDNIETINLIDDLNTPDSFSIAQSHRMVPLKMADILKSKNCKNCGSILEPVFIPPTWSKTIKGEALAKDVALANVWSAAVDELKSAFQIVVIGYSMPQTDTFFQYLLTLGLVLNSNLHRVVIANRDNSENLLARYKNIFSRSLSDRGRLIFLSSHIEKPELGNLKNTISDAIKDARSGTGGKGATFQSFVIKDMMKIGKNIDLDEE